MNTTAKSSTLWLAIATLGGLDLLMTSQILSYIHYAEDWRCGTAAGAVGMKIVGLSAISVPLAIYAAHRYVLLRVGMNAFARFMMRLPIVCLIGLLLTFFVVFRFI